jgi:methyl-accepting chemotaxis protein
MFEKMKLRQRVLLGYLAPLILMLGAMSLVFVNLQKTNNIAAARSNSEHVQFHALQAMLNLVKLQNSTRGYILYKNSVSQQSIQDNMVALNDNMQQLKATVSEAQQKETLRDYEKTANALVAILKTEVGLVDAGKPEEAVKMLRTNGINESKMLEELWKNFKQREDKIVETLNRNEENSRNIVENSIIYGMLGTIALSVIIAIWLAGTVSRRIIDNASQLSSAASEIAATINQHERTARQQATAANETSATIEELSASSRNSAEQAAAAAEVTEKAGLATVQGNETTGQAVEAMDSLKDKIGAMAEHILHLGEQTGQIGSIATVLKDLAGQINMLALNAAVEAARAGEHGKGFAVVAGEIRKLADESKKSAEQTALLVADVQKATNSSIMMTEESSLTVIDVTKLVQQVAKLFNNLAGLASSANENAQQVVLNIKQQSTAFNQVVAAATSIASGTKDTSAGISQTKIGVEKLNEAAENLKEIA